jgi:hypothetical protein
MSRPDPEDASLAQLVQKLDLRARAGLEGHEPDGPAGREAEDLLRRLDRELPGPHRAVRAALAVLGLAQAFLVAPWLVGSDPFDLLAASSSGHMSRDGSFGLMVACAALLTAWRPHWAVPSFAIASVALVAQTASAFIDEVGGLVAANEFIHLPSVVITCLVGLSAVRLPPLGPRRRTLTAVPRPRSPERRRTGHRRVQ